MYRIKYLKFPRWISGFKDLVFGTGFYYIEATFLCVEPIVQRKISFAVDTGCQITTVSFRDWLPFRNLLPRMTDKALGVGGPTPIITLKNCALFFDLNQSAHMERLQTANFSMPIVTPQNFRDIMKLPSLLGLDILSRYYVSFDANYVTLEK